jgi:glucose-1-phosphate thymidylyltransferase
MVEVADEPLLFHVFETLLEAGVDELVVVVGYRMAAIMDHFGDDYRGMPITYVHQREQRGLGHAVLQAEPYVDGQFVVLNGDNVFAGSVRPAIERARDEPVNGVVLVEELPRADARETGVVETKDGQITGLVEKPDDPPSTLATTGCYVLPEAVFDACRLLRPSERGEYELADAVDLLVGAGATVEAIRYDGERCNVNTEADIERAEELVGERG